MRACMHMHAFVQKQAPGTGKVGELIEERTIMKEYGEHFLTSELRYITVASYFTIRVVSVRYSV